MAVYLIHCPQANRIKIGYARSVPKRVDQLSTASPGPLEILAIIPDGTRKTECELRARFRDEHRYREWFAPSPGLLAFCEEYRYVAPRRRIRCRAKRKLAARDGQVDLVKRRLALSLDTELADLCGVVFQAISNWRVAGQIPPARLWKIADRAIAIGLLNADDRDSFVNEIWAPPPVSDTIDDRRAADGNQPDLFGEAA